MRHRVAGRKLGRTTAHRQAMMRNLAAALLDKERITTTLPKAKDLRSFTEKLVTLSKKESLHARRLAQSRLQDKRVVAKLFDTLSARYSERPGGYTRIMKLGPRRGDNAEMAIIELVGQETAATSDEKPKKKATKKTAGAAKPAAKKRTAKEASAKPAAKPAKKKSATRSRSTKAK